VRLEDDTSLATQVKESELSSKHLLADERRHLKAQVLTEVVAALVCVPLSRVSCLFPNISVLLKFHLEAESVVPGTAGMELSCAQAALEL